MSAVDLRLAAGVALAFGAFAQAGYLALRLLVPRRLLGAGETVSLSFGLGVGLVTFEMVVFGVLRVPFSLLSLLSPWTLAWSAFGAARLLGALPSRAEEPVVPSEAPRTSVCCAVLTAGLLLLIGVLAYRCTFHPVDLWDAFAIWDLKARAFFFDRGILPFVGDRYYEWTHLEYPLLVPLSGTFLYLCIGRVHEIVQVLALGFFVALLFQFHGVVRREGATRRAALALTAGLALLPNLLHWAYNFQAEAALAYFAFTTAAFFYLFLRSGRVAFLLLSAFSGAFLTQTKIEGPFFLLPASAVLAARAFARGPAPQDRRRLLLWSAVIATVGLPWLTYRRLVIPCQSFLSGSIVSAAVRQTGELPRVLATVLGWIARPEIGAMGLVFTVLAVLVAVERRRYLSRSAEGFLLGFFAFTLAPYVLVWVTITRLWPSVDMLSVTRYLLVCTVTAYFIVALDLAAPRSSGARRWPPRLVLAGATTLLALALSRSIALGHAFALAALLATASFGGRPRRLLSTLALAWAGLVLLAWLVPDLWLGTPTDQTRRPLSLAREVWREAAQYPTASATERAALVESENGRPDLGAAFARLERSCPDGDLAYFIKPSNEFATDDAQSYAAVENPYTVLRSAHRLYPWRVIVVTQPAKLARLLASGAVTRALAFQRRLPPELARSPNRLVHRGLWSALCGSPAGSTGASTRRPPKASQPPTGARPGVFDPADGTWRLLRARPQGRGATIDLAFGGAGGIPVAGDWDGDGMDTVGIYQSDQGGFKLRNSNRPGPPDLVVPFGGPGDLPVVGDWDGDGFDDVGVFRPSERRFFLGGNAVSAHPERIRVVIPFGGPEDLPIGGDWDGDGVDEVGVYHPASRIFALRAGNDPADGQVTTVEFGLPGDVPVAGDWDGDGIDTIGVYRPSEQRWYLNDGRRRVRAGVPIAFGRPAGRPIVGAWQGRPWFALE